MPNIAFFLFFPFNLQQTLTLASRYSIRPSSPPLSTTFSCCTILLLLLLLLSSLPPIYILWCHQRSPCRAFSVASMIGYSVCSGMRPSFYIPSPPSLVLYSLLLAARSCGPQKRQIAEQAEQNRAATSKSSGTWRHRPIFY